MLFGRQEETGPVTPLSLTAYQYTISMEYGSGYKSCYTFECEPIKLEKSKIYRIGFSWFGRTVCRQAENRKRFAEPKSLKLPE